MARTTMRAYFNLAILVAGLELLAIGVWFVLEGARIDQSDTMMVGYITGAALLASAIWLGGYRPRHDEFVEPADDTALREAKARLDRMDPARLAEHVADLCERDGLADVETVRVVEDAYAVDIHAKRGDGSLAVVRCRSTEGPGPVAGGVVEDFVTALDADLDRAGPVLLATTAGCFSAKAAAIAASAGVVLLDRGALAHWECDKETPASLAA
ncbi:restriction endonuclease [Embleya sp. NBC_00896]|uniref:restriction endonuclease n=1 Tax=Embleya sp. NBC_00896 TaxID=2975961 RepID=UPI0038680A46|nr:restriction endonuclease [Embleya sp. NBC_00896]